MKTKNELSKRAAAALAEMEATSETGTEQESSVSGGETPRDTVEGKQPLMGKASLGDKSELEREALELLQSPEFFRSLRRALRRERLVGEERNSLVIYLVALSSLLDRPLNAIVKGSSSAGKNHLVSRPLKLFPKEVVKEITSCSKTAWSYGGDDFRHAIVYLQERNDAAGAVHPVRLLISEEKLVRTVTVMEDGVRVAKMFVAEGPIASISTTTRDRIEVDDENRHISLWMDESREQTRLINQGYVSPEPPLSEHELAVWHRVYELVKVRADVRVTLPGWFKIIAENAFDASVTARRYFPAFVEACRTIALLRSFSKYRTGPPLREIEVDFSDFAVTAVLFESVFVESLHRDDDKNLNTRMAVQEISEANGDAPVTAEEVAEYMSVSTDRAYRLVRDALNAGVIRRANAPEKGNLKTYLPAERPRFVPDPEDLLKKIPQIPSVEFVHPLTDKKIKLRRKR